MISDFRSGVNDILDLLGCQAVQECRTLPEGTDMLYRNVGNYQSTLCTIPDEHWSQWSSQIYRVSFGATAPSGPGPPLSRGFSITQRRTAVGRTPLDEWSVRRRDLYLTTHNTHNTQTSMPSVEFETTISASERPQNYALDRAATGTGLKAILVL